MAQTSTAVIAGNDVTASGINKIVADITELYSGAGIPVGGVIHFWSDNTIPQNYSICDGTILSDSDSVFNGLAKPDLINRFIRGIANANIRSSVPTGGADTHNHGAATGSTTLTINQIPSHTHTVSDPGHTHGGFRDTNFRPNNGSGGYNSIAIVGATSLGIGANGVVTATTGISIQNNGGGQGHTHTISSANNIPAWTGLVPIVRVK